VYDTPKATIDKWIEELFGDDKTKKVITGHKATTNMRQDKIHVV
jgi:hypothetical protein